MIDIILGAVALGLLWGIFALGVHLTYRILDIADLTVEGTFTTGGAIAAVMLSNGVNPWLAVLAATGGGLITGLITGLLHTKLKIPALLAGILTMTALYSINLRIMGKSNISLQSVGSKKVDTVFNPVISWLQGIFGDSLSQNTTKYIASLLVALLVFAFIALVMYWFFGTELGSAIRATGNNPKMARAQGISTSFMIIICLMLSNALVALSGSLIAQYQAFSDISMGIGSIVIGLASLIIGEVIVGTRSFKRNLVALAVGAVVYRIIIALVMKLGMNPNDLKLFTAVTVTICLSLPLFKNFVKRKANRKKKISVGVPNAAFEEVSRVEDNKDKLDDLNETGDDFNSEKED